MNDLAAKITPKAVLNAVQNLPTHIDDMYAVAMQRIAAMDEYRRGITLHFLMWVTHAYRPLSPREIEYATTIQIRAEEITGEDFDCSMTTPFTYEKIKAIAREAPVDEDEIVRVDDLLSMCAGLAVIDEFGKVSLVHYTAKKYFNNVSEKWFPNSGAAIAQACLNFLVHHLPNKHSDQDFLEELEPVPFLAYASRFWGEHLVISRNRHAYDLALGFLDSKPHRDALIQAFRNRKDCSLKTLWYLNTAKPRVWGEDGTPLHIACWLGLETIVQSLLYDGHDPHARDMSGWTPLMCAAAEGFHVIVGLLLAEGAQINSADHMGRSALNLAVGSDHLEVLDVLLTREDLLVDMPDPVEDQRTSLMNASLKGHLEMVTALLQREDVDVNRKSQYTALMFAVLGGHLAVVRILSTLPRTEIDSMDSMNEQTALMLAVRTGNNIVVEALIDAGANPEIPNGSQKADETPLLYAIYKRNFPMSRLLLRRNVEWDAIDNEGRSTLQRIVMGLGVEGLPSILKSLFDRPEIEVPTFNKALALVDRIKVMQIQHTG